jgi:tRNA A-37 threonylcarbamoyl transferase component Bud32
MKAPEATRYEAGGIGRTAQEQGAIIEEVVRLVDPSFRQIPDFDYGVSDSAKEVFVGMTETGRVVVKPFCELTARDRAQHEADMIRAVQARGFQAFPNPRVYEGNRAAYLITDYVPGVKPMNNVGWEKSIDSSVYQEEHAPLLERIGTFMGAIHDSGIAHRDLWLKNVVRKVDGSFLLVDLEKAELCDGMTDAERTGAFSEDLEKFVCSLVRKRFLSTSDWSVIENELMTHLIEPYLAELERRHGSVDIGTDAAVSALTAAESLHALVGR